MVPAQSFYRVNLIRELRDREKKAERQQSLATTIGLGCFLLFILSILYSGFTMWRMEKVIASEQLKLTHLKNEYNKYKVTQLIVDKADIELLNELQTRGIFWTRKLAAIARSLPENYWITRFGYTGGELRVSGFGFASPQQDQLLTLDAYLNHLRADTTFADVFPTISLNSASRSEDNGKVAFDFTAHSKKWKAQ